MGWLYFFLFFSLRSHQTCCFTVRLRLIPRPEKIYTAPVYVLSHQKSSLYPLIFPKKISPPKLTKICTGKGVCGTKILIRKSLTFCPNQPTPHVCLGKNVTALLAKLSKSGGSILRKWHVPWNFSTKLTETSRQIKTAFPQGPTLVLI